MVRRWTNIITSSSDAESLGHWPNQDGEPRDQRTGRPAGFPQTLLHQWDRLSAKMWGSIWGKMCRTWESHGKIIGRRWAKDGTTFLLGCNCWVSFFGWRNLRNLNPILLSLVCKDNYRESTALTKKLMALKGKGESKTVTWRNVSLQLTLIEHFQMQSGI